MVRVIALSAFGFRFGPAQTATIGLHFAAVAGSIVGGDDHFSRHSPASVPTSVRSHVRAVLFAAIMHARKRWNGSVRNVSETALQWLRSAPIASWVGPGHLSCAQLLAGAVAS